MHVYIIMMPNIDKKEGWTTALFTCSCGCGQIVELHIDDDEPYEYGVWMNVVSYPTSLWQAIKWFFKEGKTYRADLCINDSDIVKMRDTLNHHIDKMSELNSKLDKAKEEALIRDLEPSMFKYDGKQITTILPDGHTETDFHCAFEDGTTGHVPRKLFIEGSMETV